VGGVVVAEGLRAESAGAALAAVGEDVAAEVGFARGFGLRFGWGFGWVDLDEIDDGEFCGLHG
jgi:hypothetical protein